MTEPEARRIIALHLLCTDLDDRWCDTCSCRGGNEHTEECDHPDYPPNGPVARLVKAELEDLTLGEWTVLLHPERALMDGAVGQEVLAHEHELVRLRD
jgi:hypothetical protein